MSTKPTIIPIEQSKRFRYREERLDTNTNLGTTSAQWLKKQPESVREPQIPWEELYPSEEITDRRVIAAQKMLTEIIKKLEMARKEANNDPIVTDDHIQSTAPLLSELFCCRSIGDGFAVVVNGVLISFLNHNGEPWEDRQIDVVIRSFKELKSRLFLSYESGIKILRDLMKAGFRPHPPALENLDLKHE